MPELQPKNVLLRQWCIEMAIKWPMAPAVPTEDDTFVDVIDLANQIYAWVLALDD